MARPRFSPLRPAPSVRSAGTLSKPVGAGRPQFQAPLLSTATVLTPNAAPYQKGGGGSRGPKKS